MSIVHRCRFVEFQPQAVQSLALNASGEDVRVAIARYDDYYYYWHTTNIEFIE